MKVKRTITGVLALTMLLSSTLAGGVSAAGSTVTLAAGKTEAKAGGTFSVDVSLADIPSTAINSLDFAVAYDTSILTVTAVTIGDSANTNAVGTDSLAAEVPVFDTTVKDGAVNVTWSTSLSTDDWIQTDGVIFTISGTVAANAKVGTETPLTFAPIARETYEGSGVANTSLIVGYIYGTAAEAYTVNAVDGSVTIVSDGTTTTTTTGTTTTTTAATTTTATTSVTTATTSGSTGEIGDVLYGDVNLDGGVTLSDAVFLNKAIVGAVELNAQARQNSNCFADAAGAMNVDDSLSLLRFLVQAIPSIPEQL